MYYLQIIWGSIISTITGIYAWRSAVQISAEATELSLLQNIQNQVSKSVELYLHSTCLPPCHILVQHNFTFTSYLCTYLSTGHILSGLIEKPFYTSLTPYMHTTWHIYFTFIDQITLTLWTVPITKLIIYFFPNCILFIYYIMNKLPFANCILCQK